MARDRSNIARGVHADEVLKRGLTEDDVRRIISETQTSPNTTPSGALPQPATPYGIAQRVDDSGKVDETVRLTTIAPNLKRFWLTHRLRRRDGTYGKPQRQAIKCTDAMKAANSAEVELAHAWHANRTVDLVHLEGKFTDDPSDDGGGYDETPKPYVETATPGIPLASFTTGASESDRSDHNQALNTKLNWGQSDWGDTNGAGTHDNHRLARWRYGRVGLFGWDIDASIPDQTVVTTTNYWSSAAHLHAASGATIPAGVIVVQSGADNLDPCVKLHHDPFDAEEPVVFEFSVYLPLLRGGGQLPQAVTCTVEDGGTNQRIATAVISFLNLAIPANTWTRVRSASVNISAGYVGAAGAGQVARFHPDREAINNFMLIDKVMVSHMPGAYSQNPRDRQVNQDQPTIRRTGAGRGQGGYGTTGGESPTTGQKLRQSTE